MPAKYSKLEAASNSDKLRPGFQPPVRQQKAEQDVGHRREHVRQPHKLQISARMAANVLKLVDPTPASNYPKAGKPIRDHHPVR